MINRRRFIQMSGAAALAGSVPLIARAAEAGDRFRLLRLQPDGDAFRSVDRCPPSACTDDTVRIRVESLVTHAQPVLASFELAMLFDADGAPQSPFVVTRHASEAAGSGSAPCAFVARRSVARQFALSYRLHGQPGSAACRHERCALTTFEQPLLQPGRYVLLSPDAAGRPIELSAIGYTGDPRRPLLATDLPAFDYLPFSIEPASAPMGADVDAGVDATVA